VRGGRRALAVTLAGALVLGAAACGGDDDDEGGLSGGPTTDGASPGGEDDASSGNGGGGGSGLADVGLTLTPVAEADGPTALVTRPGTDALYVGELGGTIRELAVSGEGADRTYELADDPLLDLDDRVIVGGTPGDERGLLDLTFSPDGATLYVHYSLNPSGDTQVDAYTMAGDSVDTGSRREVLSVPQPYTNHKGGDIEFGPDGFLYVALGDGGSAGDPEGNGQDTEALLGKVLRIDPTAPAGDRGYGIPDGNPFADGQGGAPEVWLYGVRNPWRITFHPETDDLWIADVGQNEWEEIDVLPAAGGGGAGANLGWNEREGAHDYASGEMPEGAIEPVYEYSHDEGCSITGGVIYTGEAVPGLAGAYLFADYCAGVLRAVRVDGGEVVDDHVFEDATTSEPVSFGVDAGGDAYLLSLGGDILRIDPAT
jgi:glucose/arabinose dehydrogenase